MRGGGTNASSVHNENGTCHMTKGSFPHHIGSVCRRQRLCLHATKALSTAIRQSIPIFIKLAFMQQRLCLQQEEAAFACNRISVYSELVEPRDMIQLRLHAIEALFTAGRGCVYP